MQRNTFLLILVIALLIIFGIAYGLKPRPMSKDDATGWQDHSATIAFPLYSEEIRRLQNPEPGVARSSL